MKQGQRTVTVSTETGNLSYENSKNESKKRENREEGRHETSNSKPFTLVNQINIRTSFFLLIKNQAVPKKSALYFERIDLVDNV